MCKKLISSTIVIIMCLLQLCSCAELLSSVPGSEADNGGNSGNGDNESNSTGEEEMKNSLNASVLSVKGGANGIVVLIHDDGYAGTVSIFDDLLKKHGLVGDIALVTSFVYDTEAKAPKTTAVKNFQNFLDSGRWKLISHSYTHEWWGTDGVENEERMYEEIVGSQTILRELFPGERVLTFAYPGLTSAVNKYGNSTVFSKAALAMIEKTYISGRKNISTTPHDVTDTSLNWKCLEGFGFLNGSVRNGTIAGIVNDAAENGGLALLYTHQIKSGTENKADADAASYNNIQMGSYYMGEACRIVADQVAAGKIWNTHYEDAILYIREAQTASVIAIFNSENNEIAVTLTDEMDDDIYNYALTLRINAPDGWDAVKITQGDSISYALVREIDGARYIDADIVPDVCDTAISPITLEEYQEFTTVSGVRK